MVLNLSLLVSHRTFVIILVKWWIFIKTLALKASISFFAVLLHSACAQEKFWGRSNDLDITAFTEVALWLPLQLEHFHKSLDRYRNNLCSYNLNKVYPLICSFCSDNQFYYKCNIYIWVTYAFISINIISYGCFLLFIDIPPSTTQAYLSYWLNWM